MNIIKCYLTQNRCYTIGQTITPKGVMVHSTGANNPLVARYVQPSNNDPNRDSLQATIGGNRNANDWNNPGLDVCTHAFVGKLADGGVGTVQTLPWNHRGWHAGTGTSGGSANNTHIAFEICEDDLTDEGYFRKVYQEAVELTAMLCKEYDLDPLADGVVICHSEGYTRGIASNHADVMHWFPKFGKSMDTFRQDVSKAMGGATGGNTGSSGATTKPNTGGSAAQGAVSYTVQVTVSDLNIRSGPSTDTDSKGFIAPGVYTIVEEADGPGATKWGRLKSGAGWISLDYAKRVGSATSGSSQFNPYTVKVSVTELRIRSGPGTNNASKGYIKPGVYTIVEEADGPGAKRWGKLKSGAGWISLDYAKRLGSTDTGSSSTSGSASQGFQPYTVKVSVTELRIRSGPGTDTASKGFIAPGVYTVVAEANGPGADKWGKLKSGAGWISLDYATKC